jgi:hypothetical protein
MSDSYSKDGVSGFRLQRTPFCFVHTVPELLMEIFLNFHWKSLSFRAHLGVCSVYFQPSRPAEHVTAPANCNYWVCGQSLRPSHLYRKPLGARHAS